MSLTSILKEIDRVNKKHREVERRYNRRSKGCPRQEDLQKQELQDQRIFGYSHSQILRLFKQRKCENTEETRPCTAIETRPFTANNLPQHSRKEPQMRRAQSAVKVASYKQQYNFLFKEDIFDDNHQKIRYTLPFKDQTSEQNERKMSKMLVDRSIPKTVKKMHSKSIKAQRINFIKSFDENLHRIQNKNRKKLVKVNKNHIFYSRNDSTTNSISNNENKQSEDFFKLTKAAFQKQPAKKIKVVLSTSIDNLKELQQIINQPECQKLSDFIRESSVGRYPPLLETNFLDYLPSKFQLTCITMETLQSVRLKLMLKNGNIVLQESRDTLNLGHIFQQLLANNSMVHLVFHAEGTLLYEEILVDQAFKNIQNKEHQIILLMYYLKRFLLFDAKSTLKSVRQSADLLLKSNIDLPDEFIDFVQTFQTKLIRVYDKDQRLYQFGLKTSLKNALASITAFKKQMGFGQKVVKLKHGTREQFKKYLYNWEYFYICFFLSLARLCKISTCKLNLIILMKASKNQSVKVALRVRPLNKRETEMNSPLCVQTKDNILSIKKGTDIKDFVFDYVFGIQSKQEEVYRACGFSLVQNALEGFNGTIFAYGQTGAGKTFTMVGDYKDPEWQGIIPRGFDHVMTAIQTSDNRKYVVRASFIEIYNEEIFDLLDMKGDVKKDLKESPQTGVFIKDLKCIPVKSVDEMFKLLDYGNKNRSVAKTNMNATSSRSHALFTVHIESIEDQKIKGSKLNFVDLAGSERQGKTGASGDTLKEGAKINLSLTALGNVINALVDGKKGGHIPYRDSKLTRLLQDSLGGNTKTLMCASVSPAQDNYDETVSTLRYAARARNIKNTPKVNEDPKDALIKEYMAEIDKLKKQLSSGGISTEVSESSEQLMQELERAKEKEKELTQKEAELLEMKLKMKEMEQLIMKKQKQTPQTLDKAKKRKNQKKKIQKQEQLNEFKVQELEQDDEKDLEQNEGEEKNQDIGYWKRLAKKLKRKLKNTVQDKKDQCQQFEEERERLNQCIRNLEINLSFYKQVAEKFLSESDLAALKDQSTFDYETRSMTIPPFLLHDEKLSLPKTLKRHQVDDLWKEKRKGYKLELIKEPLPDLGNKSNFLDIPESKSSIFSKDYKQPATASPLLQNRRILKYINYDDDKYKDKDFNFEHSRETFFRRTNFMIRENSNSANKRPTSSSRKFNSKTKLESISSKEKTPLQEPRPLSKGRQRLQPIIKK